ncbi:unnamed protein product [Prorocentrum cordatum]|uniref:Uncharacterized protein n=1 Tax=Prorocentrum cordatum TaxID=2364126 RepID=A0ABN9RD48_9DINO|nr:unnamed protein product [Polarella glacialis]
MKNIHWCVSIGYVAIPVSSFLTMTMAREWSVRGADHIPSWILSMRWFKPVFGDGGINAHLLNVMLFVTFSLSMAIGGPIWAQLARTQQPRKLLAAGFLLQLPFILTILPAKPTVVSSLVLVFSSGLVSSCGLLFVVMNFMMSITGDLTQAALRMGNIEMARYCASWLAAAYVFLASPSSIEGTETVAMPIKIALVMLPLAMAVAGLMAVPGGLLLHAPGPYRDDMLPGWDLGKLGNRRRLSCGLASPTVLAASQRSRPAATSAGGSPTVGSRRSWCGSAAYLASCWPAESTPGGASSRRHCRLGARP